MRPLIALGLAAALALSLSGCGDDDASAASESTPAISSFDLVVVASETNDPLNADLYGIRFDPLSAVRITRDKKISAADATASRVVVAAADGQVDQLAFVSDDGELSEIPGLGRPFAYNPTFVDDHTLMFDDILVPQEDVHINRTLTFDETAKAKTVVFQTEDSLIGSTPGPDGQIALIRTRKKAQSIVVRAASGETKQVPIEGFAGKLDWGLRYIAVGLSNTEAKPGDDPSIATVVIDPTTGKQLQLGASQPLAWTPDGTKLLVRQTGDKVNSQLAWFDPAKPDGDLEKIGGITGLVIYSGAWVKGDAF